MKKTLFVIALAALVGCASVGKDFSETDVSSIKKGVTTEQTVMTMFGKPSTITVDSDGNKVLVWTYGHANAFSVAQGKALSVKIDNNGVVDSYVLSSTTM